MEITVRSKSRNEFISITDAVQDAVARSGILNGVCHIFVPHTTAGVIINEDADPDVARDIMRYMEKIIPPHGDYRHGEGNSDAHIKASLTGPSKTVIVENGKLKLGQWQGIFFCEFDGPRTRKVWLKTV